MASTDEEFVTAYYHQDDKAIVILNNHDEHTAEGVSVKIGDHPAEEHPSTTASSEELAKEFDLAPGESYSFPFDFSQSGAQNDYVVQVTYFDEWGEKRTNTTQVFR